MRFVIAAFVSVLALLFMSRLGLPTLATLTLASALVVVAGELLVRPFVVHKKDSTTRLTAFVAYLLVGSTIEALLASFFGIGRPWDEALFRWFGLALLFAYVLYPMFRHLNREDEADLSAERLTPNASPPPPSNLP